LARLTVLGGIQRPVY